MIVRLNHQRVVLLEGESLEVSRAIVRDKSVQLVCTDPPYGKHTHDKMGKERRNDGGKVSEELWFPPMTRETVEQWATEFVRVCTGWVLICTDDRTLGWWGEAMQRAAGTDRAWVRSGQWVKTNPKPQMTADRPGSGTEQILIAHVTGEHMAWFGGGRAAVWRGNRDPEGFHPNQKPTWLMQELLGLFAPAGATVFDPFLGSGSTVVGGLATERIPGLQPLDPGCKKCAAKFSDHMENRPPIPTDLSFIGIDGHAPTLDVARQRIAPLLGVL